MNLFITILISVLVFGIIIMIHELGHFLTAKFFHVTVDEFALGMGPAFFKKEYKGTLYALRAFPIGGYVKMQGEDVGEDGIKDSDPGLLYNKPCWQRMIILAAGAAMNLILGLLICLVMAFSMPLVPTNTIASFNENAASMESGLQVRDEILKINGIRIYTDRDIVTQLLSDSDGVYEMVVRRDGEKQTLTGVKLDSNGKSLVLDFKILGEKKGFFNTVGYSFRSFGSITRSIWLSLGSLLSGKVGFSDLSGPVGVGQVIGKAVSAGLSTFLYIAAFITINIGIFNLLPLPALDGGRLFFVLIEMIRRKPVSQKYEGMIHFIGLAALMLLMLVVTAKDIFRLFS